jgi:hypothetical protein
LAGAAFTVIYSSRGDGLPARATSRLVLFAHCRVQNRVHVSVFGTQVRFVDNTRLQVILATGLLVVNLDLTDTTGTNVLVTVPVVIVNALSTVCRADWFVTGATPGVMICTETLATADTVRTV